MKNLRLIPHSSLIMVSRPLVLISFRMMPAQVLASLSFNMILLVLRLLILFQIAHVWRNARQKYKIHRIVRDRLLSRECQEKRYSFRNLRLFSRIVHRDTTCLLTCYYTYESESKIPYPSYLCSQRENYTTPSAPSRRRPPSWASGSLCYNNTTIL